MTAGTERLVWVVIAIVLVIAILLKKCSAGKKFAPLVRIQHEPGTHLI